MPKPKGLSPKQERFVHEYVRTGNAAQAYRDAGYSERNAGPDAGKILKNPNIASAVNAMREATARESIATIAEVQERLTAEVRTGGDSWVKCAELLLKSLGGLLNKSQVEHKGLPQMTRDEQVELLRAAIKELAE